MGRFLAFLFVAVAAACAEGSDSPQLIGDLAISHPLLVEPVTPDAASMYFTVTNHAVVEDTLLSVSAPFASGGAIHDVVRDGDQMRMTPVAGVPIPPGASVRLRPGGLHVMLMNLTRVPARGEQAAVFLTFRLAGSDSVSFTVVGYAQVEERMGKDHPR
ncbi:MAG TPA: copper chaperone PCu(A)C [Gemmatimonadales bacterium]